MEERGVREEGVSRAIREGQRAPAQRDLVSYRLNLEFRREWGGRYYDTQQIEVIVAEESERVVVVTVYARSTSRKGS